MSNILHFIISTKIRFREIINIDYVSNTVTTFKGEGDEVLGKTDRMWNIFCLREEFWQTEK